MPLIIRLSLYLTPPPPISPSFVLKATDLISVVGVPCHNLADGNHDSICQHSWNVTPCAGGGEEERGHLVSRRGGRHHVKKLYDSRILICVATHFNIRCKGKC